MTIAVRVSKASAAWAAVAAGTVKSMTTSEASNNARASSITTAPTVFEPTSKPRS